MQNIDVHFNATSNFKGVEAQLAALRAQANALATSFAKGAHAGQPALVDTAKWKSASRAVHEASNAYRNAASSSGLLTTQQIRATSEAENYTKALQKQKLSFADMRKHRGIMKEVYRDQLRYQRMTAQYWGTDASGRAITDITIPKNYPRDLDTAAQRMYFLGQATKSASTQMINMGKNMQWAGRQLTVGFTYPVTLFGAAAGMMAYKADEALTRVAKVYDVSAAAQQNEAMRTKELGKLREDSFNLATEAAKSYGMSMNDTLEIEQRLAATGLRGERLLGSTKEVSRIATLGDIEIGMATDMTIALQNAFKDTIKTTDDLTRTFNYMNAVENATSLGLNDIAEATPRAAAALAGLNVTAEEMTVMLVAMRQAGVDAAQGANALKSASTRIINPVRQAVDYYDEFGISLEKISKDTGGNLFEFLKQLSQEQQKIFVEAENGTKAARIKAQKETDLLRQKGIAKIFGTYQYSRLNAALSGIGDVMNGTAKKTDQTAKAMNLLNNMMKDTTGTSKELADAADREIAEKMEAVSGRVKAAWESLRVELSKMGMPFLEIAAAILEVTGSVAKMFNGLSKGQKQVAMVIAAIAGIAGPVIMLGGLFANLVGHFTKGIGGVMTLFGKLGGAVGLFNKEERAAMATTRAQNAAMDKQVTSTSTLAREMEILAASYQKATDAAKQYLLTQGVNTGPEAPRTIKTSAGRYQMSAMEQQYFDNTSNRKSGRFIHDETRLWSARNKMAEDYMKANGQIARNASQTVKQAHAENKIRAAMNRKISAGSVGMAAMAASSAAMLISTNETTDNIAKWVMIGTLVVPAVSMLASLTAKAAKAAWVFAAGQAAGAKSAALAARENMAMAGRMGAVKAGAAGLYAGARSLVSPLNVAVLGVAAVTAGYVTLRNRQKEVAAEQKQLVDNQAKLVSSTEKWAESAGKVANGYRSLADATANLRSPKSNQTYEFYNSEEQKGAIKGYKSMSGQEKATADTMKYIDLIKKFGLTADEAEKHMLQFFLATGESALDAEYKARNLRIELGNLKNIKWEEALSEGVSAMAGNLNDLIRGDDAEVKQQAKQLGAMFMESFTTGSRSSREDMTKQLQKQMYDPWEDLRQKMLDAPGEFLQSNPDMLKDAQSLKEAYWGMDEAQREMAFSYREMTESGTYLTQTNLLDIAMANEQLERSYVGAIAEHGKLGENVDTVNELLKNTVIRSRMISFAQAKQDAQDLYNRFKVMQSMAASPMGQILGMDEQKVLQDFETSMNALADGQNIKRGNTMWKTLQNILQGVERDAKKAKEKTDDLGKSANELDNKTISIQIKQVGGIVQNAMAAVQNRMADSAMNQFNSDWDARMDAAQNSWDARQDALQAKHDAVQRGMERKQENAQDAFDNRWERRKEAIEKTYDKRIERINKEIEREKRADAVRQRLYEREKARLQRLAELANANIDFNTAMNEGRLDEAAKTLNNARANAESEQMDAEQKAAEARTQRKVEALEKKNERLEKQRDKELKNLEKLEERMRKHLERVQDARRRALEKQQAQEVKALERSEEAAMSSMEHQRDYEEAMLEERLELFKSYTARNQKDLEKWMDKVGLSYEKFGSDVKAMGEEWSTYFRTELSKQIRKAGVEVANDNSWKKTGKAIGNKLLEGLGFKGIKDFRRFVETGRRSGVGGKGGDDTEVRHTGGEIGSGKGSRGNIPNSYKGLHRTETKVLAQKGEYMVNKKAAEKYRPILDSINFGGDVPMGGFSDSMAGAAQNGYGGPAALMSGAIVNMWKQGVAKAYDNAYQRGLKKESRLMAMFTGSRFAGDAGIYGGRNFTANQMKNAATIASVGSSMGMSKRDLMIGIMTAIAESGLVNVNYGDRDSLGLFQQRPSMGWGSPAQVTDPEYASTKFFNALRGVGNRNDMTPWMAAQTVQRSAFADGSNYQRWWAAAQAIFGKGLNKKKGGGYTTGGGFVAGKGGKHRPIRANVTNGLHGGSTAGNPPAVDFAAPTGRPVYAVSDGVITQSRDIAGPLPSDTYRGSGPYGSFGRMIQMRTNGGAHVLYAHLSRRSVPEGKQVRGGSVIGYSGNTGNSSGPHLHFGATNGPYAWLRRGGEIKYDNTQVVAHRGETMLSAPVTKQLKENIASGGGDEYNVTIDLRGAYIKEDVDLEKAVNAAIDKKENKLGRKRVVK